MKNLTIILALLFISVIFISNAYSQNANNNYNSSKSNSAGIMVKETPLTGMSMYLSTGKTKKEGKTDENGLLVFTSLSEGTYTITPGKTPGKWAGFLLTVMPESETEAYTMVLETPVTVLKKGVSFYIPKSKFISIRSVTPEVKSIAIDDEEVKAIDISLNEPGVK
jgi:hypothetical protein